MGIGCHRTRVFVWLLFCLFFAGCGPSYDLGQVSGIVTLDGTPLPQATLIFSRGKGRMAVGMTDEDGRYRLQYTHRQEGAELGTHTVRVTSRVDAVSGEGGVPAIAGRPELLPARYHDKTELTAEVKRGRNTIDFNLTSDTK